MWRQIGKLIFHIAVIVLPVVLAMEIFCAAFPDVYMDGEYAMYKQQKDYVSENTDNNRVLIIGDSRAKACFKPDELGDDVYNISLGGISPVETYYLLSEYLENHEAPEYLFLAFAPIHQCQPAENANDYVLWTRCIYFHTFNQKDLFDLKRKSREFENTEMVDREHFYIEYMMHKLYFPNKYGTALRNAVFENRYQKNKQKYAEVSADRGYSLFGTLGPCGGVNGEAKRDDFVRSDLIDAYYNQVFELCREHDIQAIVVQPPMLDVSFYILKDKFLYHYTDYMYWLSEENPDVWIQSDIPVFSAELFGDDDHLNTEGAAVYADMIKELYPQVFRE